MLKTVNSFYRSDNVFNLEENRLIKKLEDIRNGGETIGLCSGSFDLLHPGHMTHLNSAKKLCDILIVGVANNEFSESKKIRKGRPIFSGQVRAYSIIQLKAIDYAILHGDEYKIIDVIRPNFYIKGPDYLSRNDPELEKVVKFLEARGGKICFTKDESLSTTQVINYIKNNVE